MLTYFVEIERLVSRLRAVESCFEERRPAIVHRQTRAALVVLSHIIYRPIAVRLKILRCCLHRQHSIVLRNTDGNIARYQDAQKALLSN